MKKRTIVMTLVSLLVSATVMAQGNDQNRPPRMDKAEMIQRRTQHMVEQYGLNATQAKQLKELNEQYADKLRPGRGPRPDGVRPDGQKPDEKKADTKQKDTKKKDKKKKKDENAQQPPKDGERAQGNRPPRMNPEMEANRKAYEAELQKIMTPEQFQKYQADAAKRPQRGPGRGR